MSFVHEIIPTERETEILTLLNKGLSQVKVAKQLFLSPRTIETYLSIMRKKFNCGSTGQLIGKAVGKKWIE